MMAPGGPSSRRTPEDSTTPRHTRTSPIARVRVLAGVVTWRDAIRRDYNQHVRSPGGHAGESSTNEPDGATRPRHTAASASDVVSLRAAMKILFIMRHSGYVRNFESTLRLLCDRGHHVHLAFHVAVRRWLENATDLPEQLAAEYPNFSWGLAPTRQDGWGLLGRELRRGLDYLRYLTPRYRHATKLRHRAEEDVDPAILRAAQHGGVRRWWLTRMLRVLDRGIPRSAEIDLFIDDHRPDL